MMDTIIRGFQQALALIARGDRALLPVVQLSLTVSGLALLISTLIGIPLGSWLALHDFPGRWLAIALLYTRMGLPPVVVGLFVYLLLSREGPLGSLGWLFTPLLKTPTRPPSCAVR